MEIEHEAEPMQVFPRASTVFRVSTLSNASRAYNGDLYEGSLWVFGARGEAEAGADAFFVIDFRFPQRTRTFHAVNALKTIRKS